MTTILFRVSSFDTGASIILLLPEVSPSGDGTYETIISFRMKVKGASILGIGTSRSEKTLAFAYCCGAAKLKSAPLFFFTSINRFKASKAGIVAILRKVQGVRGKSIGSASWIKGNKGSYFGFLNRKTIVFMTIVSRVHR